jgi:hypothetical protein
MKEFEKWLCENYGALMDGTSFEYNTKESWEAAFENMQQWIMGRRCTGEDMLDYINKELGNA